MCGQPIDIPAILVAALRGGSGKTVITIGIISALAGKGYLVSPFKKGPDYIDAGWLAMAAGRPCHNLDPYLFSLPDVGRSFFSHASGADISVIEGNRGLFDGLDVNGATSTAQLAKYLGIPVILCIDCAKSTRTMAALVSGCQAFDPEVDIKGVILNRVAGSRHESILRQCIETYCDLSVIGSVGKLSGQDFPERHMGLVPTPEHAWATASIDAARRVAEQCIDLDSMLHIIRAKPVHAPGRVDLPGFCAKSSSLDFSIRRPIIGVALDSAFQFYYPENIEAIKMAGGNISIVSPLSDKSFPEMDALYIGGGFPETHAEQLSENNGFKEGVRNAVEAGMPVYAECGGLMYLGQSLELDRKYPMAGIFPVTFGFSAKPRGHGYTHAIVTGKNPFFPVGYELFGHEFHYSKIAGQDVLPKMVFSMIKGMGIRGQKDAMVYKNVLATYTHIHSLGNPGWAAAIVEAARDHHKRKKAA